MINFILAALLFSYFSSASWGETDRVADIRKEKQSLDSTVDLKQSYEYNNSGLAHALEDFNRAIADFHRAKEIFLQNGELENYEKVQQFLKPRQSNLILLKSA